MEMGAFKEIMETYEDRLDVYQYLLLQLDN
jgi:hypothetical protein